MTTLISLARFVHDFELESLPPETLDRLELHLLDTLGALDTGSNIAGAKPLAAMGSSLLANVAATRATELDDIHLPSGITPGSVVVPTALSLSAASPRDFLATLAVGYELMMRLGLAIGGPWILGHGVWPTLFTAPLASAATAARALRLSIEQTTGAMATALALTSGTTIRPGSPSTSRWLTLGWAAETGVQAAKAARENILGPPDLLEGLGSRLAGVDLSEARLVESLGDSWRIDELSLKPYPVARQALAAVEACRELGEANRLEPSAIDEVLVQVPELQRSVIDQPGFPETRFGSIVSVQYLTAVALVAPTELLDFQRAPLFVNDALRNLATRVRVESAPELEHYYPRIWPARVAIRCGRKRYEKELLHPPGDVGSGFGWDAVMAKYGFGGDTPACELRGLHEKAVFPSSWPEVQAS
ncbi:MAG TPA: MmgE/PrpD family protein [Vicinamibacteria bacterium]|nr:MmgE/PrpD family protein [Vicinamibacteria bacterium]